MSRGKLRQITLEKIPWHENLEVQRKGKTFECVFYRAITVFVMENAFVNQNICFSIKKCVCKQKSKILQLQGV